MPKGLVTIKSAAEILQVSVETLRNWDKTGRLKAIRDPKNKYRFYSISALEHFKTKAGQHIKSPTKYRLTN